MTTTDPGGRSRDRVISGLVASVPGLDIASAQRVLAAARADHGRALREVDALLAEHPAALVTTPAAYPLALVRLAHALIGDQRGRALSDLTQAHLDQWLADGATTRRGRALLPPVGPQPRPSQRTDRAASLAPGSGTAAR